MKNKELIALLQQEDPEADVLIGDPVTDGITGRVDRVEPAPTDSCVVIWSD